jgi:septation ring formation regulator EzrA
MPTTETEIRALIKRRDTLRTNVDRVQGRLDSAKKELAAAEEECRKKKVDPAKIDEVITQLTSRLDAETAALTARIDAAEKKVAPFLTEE